MSDAPKSIYPDTTDAAFRWSCPQCNYSVTPNEIFSERKHFDAHALECVRCLYRTETKPTWEEAKAAYCRAPAQGWQDISTAPKDYTPVLLIENFTRVYDDLPYAPEQMVGQYSQRAGKWSSFGVILDSFAPTHWMPLPKDPEVSSTTCATPSCPEPRYVDPVNACDDRSTIGAKSRAHGCKRAGGFVDSNCMAMCDCHVTLAHTSPREPGAT